MMAARGPNRDAQATDASGVMSSNMSPSSVSPAADISEGPPAPPHGPNVIPPAARGGATGRYARANLPALDAVLADISHVGIGIGVGLGVDAPCP